MVRLYHFCLQIISTHALLLYPPTSVLQLTGSISVPVVDLPPQRRVAFDWGFQMNYNMPINVSNFYNIPIWSVGNTSSTNRLMRRETEKYFRDYTLKDIYEAIEEILESIGFHASCLMLAICDLMQFPFVKQEQYVIAELVSFFLSPSQMQHRAAADERKLEAYLLAELWGKKNVNCKKIFGKCTKNPLDLFSKAANGRDIIS